jgi:hypothetical protein
MHCLCMLLGRSCIFFWQAKEGAARVAFCGPFNALARARGGLVVAGAGRHGASGPGAQGLQRAHPHCPGSGPLRPYSLCLPGELRVTLRHPFCLRGAPLPHSRNWRTPRPSLSAPAGSGRSTGWPSESPGEPPQLYRGASQLESVLRF